MTGGPWTPGEMLAVAAARFINDGDVALVGLGLPQVAAVLARRTRAPSATLLLEIGVFQPDPRGPNMGIADPLMWEGSASYGSMIDVLGSMLQSGRVTLGLLGALQVDRYGSINSTQVVGPEGKIRRFNGSGGANDVASLARRTVIVMRHQARKLPAALDFLTSPGRRVRGQSRAEMGLPGDGPAAIVTDRAVLAVTDTGAVLQSVHPGEDAATILADTPMGASMPAAGVAETTAPLPEELELIRRQLDPLGWYTGP